MRVAHADVTLEAFRVEIGAVVTRVSPMLLALLRRDCLRLDKVVDAIRPASR